MEDYKRNNSSKYVTSFVTFPKNYFSTLGKNNNNNNRTKHYNNLFLTIVTNVTLTIKPVLQKPPLKINVPVAKNQKAEKVMYQPIQIVQRIITVQINEMRCRKDRHEKHAVSIYR